MKGLRNIGRKAKANFTRLRNRAGKFAFMGGKKKKQGIQKAKKTDNKMVVASDRSRVDFMDAQTLKARRKQALGYAFRNPGKVLRFAANALFSKGGKGYGARMGVKNAFSTVKANIPQGFKDRTRAFAAKYNLKGKAQTTWEVTKVLGRDPIFVASALTSVVLLARAAQEVSSMEKARQAKAKPFF
jgi:hypothetical protein